MNERKAVLLTGEPHAGKSTLLKRVLTEVTQPKHGFWTEEMAVSGVRTGFRIVTHADERFLLASTQLPTAIQVSRYFVQLPHLEEAIRALQPLPEQGLLYLDEIGQMQLYSKQFEQLVKEMLTSPLPFVGTISQVYEHPLIKEIKERSDVEIITVTPQNRDQLLGRIVQRLKEFGV